MLTGDTIGDWEALKGGDNGEDPVAGLSGWSGGRLDGIDCKAGAAGKGLASRMLKSFPDVKFDCDDDVNEEKSAKLSCLKIKFQSKKHEETRYLI